MATSAGWLSSSGVQSRRRRGVTGARSAAATSTIDDRQYLLLRFVGGLGDVLAAQRRDDRLADGGARLGYLDDQRIGAVRHGVRDLALHDLDHAGRRCQ